MKNLKKQTLEEFENFLLQAVKQRGEIPFSSDEVIQIFQKYNPPEDLEELRDESIIQVMKEEYSKRIQYQKKLRDFSLVNSLGELIQIFCDYKNISPVKLSQMIGLSNEEFKKYEKDQIAPELFNKKVIFNLMLLVNVSFNEMIQILEKTVKLFQIKQNTKMTPSYARMEKSNQEITRMRIRDSATKELLLNLKDEDQNKLTDLEKLGMDLVNDLKSEFENIGECYTIRTKRREKYIDKILTQI